MGKKWILVYGNYSGLEAKAVNLLAAKAEEYLGYELAVYSAEKADKKTLEESNVIYAGTLADQKYIGARYENVADGDDQGYLYEVVKKEGGNDIYVAGNTEVGTYYGAIAFLTHYLPKAPLLISENGNFNIKDFFKTPFKEQMSEAKEESAPSIKRRAIWTWGHVIFDYEKFFANMSLLRLNEIVIWNDHMPVNAKQVVECAHEYGIRVIFGFSWGWNTNCGGFDIRSCFDKEKVREFSQGVLSNYEKEILPASADGIYFQSFTEIYSDNIDGVNIAEAVTVWVNEIAGALYEKYPDLEIQFGLHAMSVRNHLEYLKAVDKRIKIVWEDCGAFPYNYSPAATKDFEETEAFTKAAMALRGKDDRFAAVFKGLTTLYWFSFAYRDGAYILGKASEEKIRAVSEDRASAWKYIQSMWLKNAECVRKITADISLAMRGKSEIQLLTEYGAFEKHIYFPVALASEILWSAQEPSDELIERAAMNPYAYFENL